MNKKVMKIMSVLMIVMMLVATVSPVFGLYDPENIKNDQKLADDKVKTIGTAVLSVITTAGIAISVIVIAGLGIKYITGSAEEKAEYKKSLVPLLIGMVLLLGASGFAKFLVSMAK